jgi:hypothetical protein
MESRREPRFAADCPVVASVSGIRRAARMLSAGPWGISIEIDTPASPGAAISIDFGDSVAAGEVTYCRAAGGAYYVGVQLECARKSIADIAPLPDESPPLQNSV